MSRKSIAEMFDVLTPEERTSLTFAASARGDEAELERLITSAPRHTVSVLHHSGVIRALCICGCIHRAEQLEAIAGYFFAIGRAHNAIDDEDSETAVWRVKMSNLFAYRFCLNREAWRLFCADLGVCGEHVVDGAAGGWIIDLADTNMPDIAPNDEEMAEQMRDLLGDEVELSEVVTAERAMENWKALYRGLLGR